MWVSSCQRCASPLKLAVCCPNGQQELSGGVGSEPSLSVRIVIASVVVEYQQRNEKSSTSRTVRVGSLQVHRKPLRSHTGEHRPHGGWTCGLLMRCWVYPPTPRIGGTTGLLSGEVKGSLMGGWGLTPASDVHHPRVLLRVSLGPKPLL